MRTLNKARRSMYRSASILGDINAITRGPGPAAKRFLIRKPLWRTFLKGMTKVK